MCGRRTTSGVYEAYTTPGLVKRWLLGPPGWTMPVCEMDLWVGGTYRWLWREKEGGAQFGFHTVTSLMDFGSKERGTLRCPRA
jgi:uncharacterized protein YndB with AHSA1/START domain